MKHIEISGQEVLIAKGTSDILINDEGLGKQILKALPNMKDYKDYVCDIKVSINVYGADNNELEVLKDFEDEGVVIDD